MSRMKCYCSYVRSIKLFIGPIVHDAYGKQANAVAMCMRRHAQSHSKASEAVLNIYSQDDEQSNAASAEEGVTLHFRSFPDVGILC